MSPGCAHLAQRLEPIDRQITVLSGMIERLENRLTEDENNYGRALALLEDRIKDLEAVGESVAERLCQLESTKTRKGDGLRDVAVLYRCTACNPTEGLPPCACVLDANLGKPDGCIYRKGCPAEWITVGVDLSGLILQAVQE